jgi:zinc/manganese transport system substrate-binding protein
MRQILTLGVVLTLGTLAGGCGSDDETTGGGGTDGDRPSIVVTTNILGDVVGEVVGDLADVEVIMPLGADPHDFAPSAKQAEAMENADLLVVNGAGFEEGMDGVIDSVVDGGTMIYAFADSIDLLEGDEATRTDEETHGDKNGHGGFDPHLWTDPARMVDGVRGLGAALAPVEGIDRQSLDTQLNNYIDRLEALDTEIETALGAVQADDRVLVTNHEVFGYFADRYGFEIVGAVVPSLSTSAETSARELEDLAAIITAEGIPAIFAETTQSTDLADALADEVGGEVAVVELFTESLGEPGSGAETYIDLMRTNAKRIVAALTGA